MKSLILSTFLIARAFTSSSQITLVKDVNAAAASNGYPGMKSFASLDNTLYFSADTQDRELWKSDGTTSGTVLVKDIKSGVFSSNPTDITAANTMLFFIADDGVHGDELWKTDGTTSGTLLVKDINLGSADSYLRNLFTINDVLYFTVDDGVHGKELWKSDGTTSGTVMLKDINSGSDDSDPSNFINLNNTLYFSANDGVNGGELWKSDGTTSGTVMVKNINPDAFVSYYGSSNPSNFTILNNTLYFSASNGTNNSELWQSDGTASGTGMVKNINPSANSFPEELMTINGVIYFSANADGNVSGTELWKSDGTSSGTVMVKNINPGYYGSDPRDFTNVNGVLFFTAEDGVNGRELWKSDGTSVGTVMLKDITVGSAGSVGFLTEVNNVLYFVANDGVHGDELWKTDGTASGTVMVQDFNVGSGNSFFSYFTNFNNKLYFRSSSNGVNGLWNLDGGITSVANKIALENKMTIYPNPTQGIVNIISGNLKTYSIRVFNTSGQLVYNKENINVLDYQFNLNESPGVYFIEVNSSKSIEQHKLIIE